MLKKIFQNLKSMVTGLSWVGKLNVYIFQWLFFRLSFQVQHRLVKDKTIKLRKCNFSLLFPVIPLTGWWSDYWPNNHFIIRLYKKQPEPYKRMDNSDLNELLQKATKKG